MNAQLEKIASPEKIASEVIYNQDICNLLQNPNNDGLYKDLVDFQRNECKKHNSSIATEGFQIGEPWNGDIENAPILFLSSNPAHNFYEISPRWHWDNSDNGGKKILKSKKLFEVRKNDIDVL